MKSTNSALARCGAAARPLLLLLAISLACQAAHAGSYKYCRVGSPAAVATRPEFGVAMMGGGDDLDDAFRWLCNKGHGGDFLVLRAAGKDDYNSYIRGLCNTNSVATLLIPSREAAQNPKVAVIIRAAAVVFISGGDQSHYINWWQGTPVQQALNAHIAAGKPVGGTSAGLAVLGEFAYGALGDQPKDKDLASADVLPNPYHPRVTVVRGFLHIPQLERTITDTHFVPRNRLGRTLVFLARIMQDAAVAGAPIVPRSVAVDETSAVLLEPDGSGTVIGPGRGAYLIQPSHPPEVCEKGKPLTFRDLAVLHVPRGGKLNLGDGTASGARKYSLMVEAGVVRSSQEGGSFY